MDTFDDADRYGRDLQLGGRAPEAARLGTVARIEGYGVRNVTSRPGSVGVVGKLQEIPWKG